ncbi:hypothetical protein M885DRAFT_243850 [Pelagophyceae sp. CCMP2097]|nr:hypothetical protein M885DRAFT_243850 [Pelagophyceae sp. CCMP2097]
MECFGELRPGHRAHTWFPGALAGAALVDEPRRRTTARDGVAGPFEEDCSTAAALRSDGFFISRDVARGLQHRLEDCDVVLSTCGGEHRPIVLTLLPTTERALADLARTGDDGACVCDGGPAKRPRAGPPQPSALDAICARSFASAARDSRCSPATNDRAIRAAALARKHELAFGGGDRDRQLTSGRRNGAEPRASVVNSSALALSRAEALVVSWPHALRTRNDCEALARSVPFLTTEGWLFKVIADAVVRGGDDRDATLLDSLALPTSDGRACSPSDVAACCAIADIAKIFGVGVGRGLAEFRNAQYALRAAAAAGNDFGAPSLTDAPTIAAELGARGLPVTLQGALGLGAQEVGAAPRPGARLGFARHHDFSLPLDDATFDEMQSSWSASAARGGGSAGAAAATTPTFWCLTLHGARTRARATCSRELRASCTAAATSSTCRPQWAAAKTASRLRLAAGRRCTACSPPLLQSRTRLWARAAALTWAPTSPRCRTFPSSAPTSTPRPPAGLTG